MITPYVDDNGSCLIKVELLDDPAEAKDLFGSISGTLVHVWAVYTPMCHSPRAVAEVVGVINSHET